MNDYYREIHQITGKNYEDSDFTVGKVYVGYMYPRTGFFIYCGDKNGVKCFTPVNFPKDKNMLPLEEYFFSDKHHSNKIEWFYDRCFDQDINALNDFVRTEMSATGEGGHWGLRIGRDRPYIPWSDQEEIFLWQVFNPYIPLSWFSKPREDRPDKEGSEPWSIPYLPTNEEAFHQKPVSEFRYLSF